MLSSLTSLQKVNCQNHQVLASHPPWGNFLSMLIQTSQNFYTSNLFDGKKHRFNFIISSPFHATILPTIEYQILFTQWKCHNIDGSVGMYVWRYVQWWRYQWKEGVDNWSSLKVSSYGFWDERFLKFHPQTHCYQSS
jgi:hypothetical protein